MKKRKEKLSLEECNEKINELCCPSEPTFISRRLTFDFFNNPCEKLAKSLLGKVLVRKIGDILLKAYIVETESYIGIEDKASHSYSGKITNRNKPMFMRPGTIYVYIIYGMYHCLNITSQGSGAAVLIRSVEPFEGLHIMEQYRKKKRTSVKYKDLCNGPSKLCEAFEITKLLNCHDMSNCLNLWVEEGLLIPSENIMSCKRIGIESAGAEWANKLLRYYIKDNKFVSKK